jgi:hypothetical protein
LKKTAQYQKCLPASLSLKLQRSKAKEARKRHPGTTAFLDVIYMLVVFIGLQSFSMMEKNMSSAVLHGPEKYETNFYSNGDTLVFAGYQWTTKESNDRHTGPGRNYFAGGRDNVWVDDKGRMHLRITHNNGHWYCAEARMVESLGYGKYIFQLEANPAKLDKDLVVGFFTYDHGDTLNNHREIDIEFSNWGMEKNDNSQYVLQPHEIPENVHRFNTDLSKKTQHIIGWKKNKICFSSSYVTMVGDSERIEKYAEWNYKPPTKLRNSNEKFSMNIWIFKADFPSDFNDYEFIVSKFEFIPHKLF